ncbi:hypothetical protein AB0I81_60570 [Nonomuraea sp. NPDC050404]|uniref:hypothetical protein n=1 Tax=Nonomuraea sp. NPDC050404 TaxID=3155783 RepID=UPI0033DA4F7A
MLSRSKRIFGVTALALAAATMTAAPAHADDDFLSGISFLEEVQGPLCVPGTSLGIPLIDALIPELMACARAQVVG